MRYIPVVPCFRLRCPSANDITSLSPASKLDGNHMGRVGISSRHFHCVPDSNSHTNAKSMAPRSWDQLYINLHDSSLVCRPISAPVALGAREEQEDKGDSSSEQCSQVFRVMDFVICPVGRKAAFDVQKYVPLKKVPCNQTERYFQLALKQFAAIGLDSLGTFAGLLARVH